MDIASFFRLYERADDEARGAWLLPYSLQCQVLWREASNRPGGTAVALLIGVLIGIAATASVLLGGGRVNKSACARARASVSRLLSLRGERGQDVWITEVQCKPDPFAAAPRNGYAVLLGQRLLPWPFAAAPGAIGISNPSRSVPCSTPQSACMRSCRYLTWEEYFMAVAFLSAQRSKDPNKQAGLPADCWYISFYSPLCGKDSGCSPVHNCNFAQPQSAVLTAAMVTGGCMYCEPGQHHSGHWL